MSRNPTLEQFRAMFIAGNEAFNRGDFAAAFAGVARDCEYRPVAYATEGLLVGREQICRFFEREIFGTFSDWRTEPVGFLQSGDGVFVVLLRGTGTGSASGVPTTVDFGAVWKLRNGVPVRVDEYPTPEEAVTAAGLDRSAAARARNA
jgi:ketosteroid isomerase-like protein